MLGEPDLDQGLSPLTGKTPKTVVVRVGALNYHVRYKWSGLPIRENVIWRENIGEMITGRHGACPNLSAP